VPILGSQGGLSSRGFGQFTETLPPPTSPVDGYHLWLDADNAASFTYSSGTVVSQWTDRSANALTFTTTATINQPNRNGVQNSKSTVVFDGSRNYLKSTSAPSTWKYLHDGSGATVFFVVKSNEQVQPATSVFSPIFSTENSNIGASFGISGAPSEVYNSPLMRIVNASGGSVNNNFPIFNTGYNIHTYKLDPGNSFYLNKILYYINSSSELGASFSTFVPSTSDPTGTLCLGTWFNGFFGDAGGYPEYMFSGAIAEILTYKSILSESDRIANVNYLKSKWGISANQI
jgi:hypothetical protein